MTLNPTPLEVLILVLVSLSIYVWIQHGSAIRNWWRELWKKRRGKRQLKPKSPEVCPRCTIWSHILPGHGRRHVRPWCEVRGKSGRRKRIDTRGYACQNPACEYYGVTDPAIHALVSAGRRGVRKDILFLRCQACGQRQTSRTDTPVRGLKTPLEQVRLVVMALAEGLDLSAASRCRRRERSTTTCAELSTTQWHSADRVRSGWSVRQLVVGRLAQAAEGVREKVVKLLDIHS